MSLRHWVSMQPGNDSAKTISEILTRCPHAQGVLKHYRWAELERGRTATDAEYTFGELTADLALCKQRKKKLVAMIDDKTFFETDAHPLPEYLREKALANRPGGYTAIRWDDQVAQRYRRMLRAIAKLDVSALGGIALQETAPSLTDAALEAAGYRWEDYCSTYVDHIVCIHQQFNVPAFWFGNFIPKTRTGLDYVCERVQSLGIASIGGPDLWPTSKVLTETVYPAWRRQPIPRFCGVSVPSYSQPDGEGGYMTMEEVLAYGTDWIGLDDIFWMYLRAPTTPGGWCIKQAIPLMAPA